MKKRYYLRGLGMGILFTALFFMVGGKSEPVMSDEMIIERAKELGMIENTVLADIGSAEMSEVGTEEVMISEESVEEAVSEMLEETTEEEITEEEVVITALEETEESTSEEVSETVEETESSEEVVVEASDAVPSDEESSETSVQTGQMLSVVVNKGEGSDTVSHRLHEMGLVDDPYAFDRYLMQNGYDKRIGAGEHLIPEGASWQEIAKILTS